jgi:alkylmercury lyase
MRADSDVSVEDLDSALATARPSLDEDGQRLAVGVYERLAVGAAVGISDAAMQAGVDVERAEQLLRSWPAAFFDQTARVEGFWGLARDRMPHRLTHDGVDLFAWCAWDPFFLARIIGELHLTATDPVTHETISYTFGPDDSIDGEGLDESVLSFLRPDQPWDDTVITNFCHYIWHFTSVESGKSWTAAHGRTFTVGLDDAVELGLRHYRRSFDGALQ